MNYKDHMKMFTQPAYMGIIKDHTTTSMFILLAKHQNFHFWELKEELKRTKDIKIVMFQIY